MKRITKKALQGILIILLLTGCAAGGSKDPFADGYSKDMDDGHRFPIHDGRGDIECYGTFERYMWDEGFPDTIIVKFTMDGKFVGYKEAVRYDLVRDSLGNYYSPGYAVISGVGDIWIYDIKGRFVEFGCNSAPHSGSPHTYKP